MNTTDKRKKGHYESLKGFHRSVPIILFAFAVFIAICFITSGTGALGSAISSVLTGLFAAGAYAIPVLLIIHGIFYAEDVAKRRVISRIIFSVITVLVVSAIEYTIVFWGKEFVFAPAKYYSEKNAGGFIGSTVAFALVKMLGSVGIYILAAALLAIYITFFFSGKNTALGRVMYTVLGFFAGILALIERGIKKLFGTAVNAKEKKKIKENNKKNRQLLDDPFFTVDNGLSSLKINEPAAVEEKNEEAKKARAENEEPLHNDTPKAEKKSIDLNLGRSSAPSAVFSESTPKAAEESEEKIDELFTSASPAKKTSLDSELYGLDESADKVFTSSFDPFDFAVNQKNAAKPSTKSVNAQISGIGEITRPLSAMTNEEIMAENERREFERKKKDIIAFRKKMAGKAEDGQGASDGEGIESNEYQPAPARSPSKTVEFNVSNEPSVVERKPVEGSTFRGTFEKQEYREHDAEKAAAHIAEVVAMNNPAYARSSNEIYTYVKITESPAEEPKAADVPVIDADAEEYTPPIITAEEYTVEEVAEAVYTSPELPTAEAPINNEEDNTPEVPFTDYGGIQSAAIDAAPIFEVREIEEPAQSPFKPYTPPSFEEPAEETKTEEQTLKIERTMLTPNVSASTERDQRYTLLSDEMKVLEDDKEAAEDEDNSECSFSFELDRADIPTPSLQSPSDDGTILSFEDDEEEEEDTQEDFYNEIPEEDAIISEQIPLDEQNPEVINQRKLFPFLDRENAEEKENEVIEPAQLPSINEEEPEDKEAEFVPYEEAADDSADEENEPPFDIDEPIAQPAPKAAATVNAVVPAAEAKKKSDENKKPDYSSFVFPPIDMLGKDEKVTSDNVDEEIQDNADKLIETLASFNVTASIKGVDRGPRITRYEVVPAKGVKVSSVMNLQDDIALGLAAEGIRMEAPIPGKSAIGVEIPNIKEETVRLRELLETEDFINAKSKTTVCIGKDVTGQPVINDIAKMPHLLIAGATGMGKSVCINSLLISILYKARPDEVKFIMIDPKQVEFTMYNGIPHLLVPVVSDAKQAAGALMWAVEEMERRYNLLNAQYVRNVDAYNEKVKDDPSIGEPMSRIVIVIDEFADLMLQVRDPVENLVMRIAQKARAAGIHLIIGTQRPAVNVITGTIKANIPSRISCKVASNTDSRTVLDAGGAEKLLNKGDMLFSYSGAIKPLRVQGAFVKDSEVEAIMKYLQQFSNGESYDKTVMEEIERAAQKCSKKGGDDRSDDADESSGEGYLNDRQFLDAVELAVNSGRIATSFIQRKLSIGYGKAAKFLDIMVDMGIVSEGNGPKPREVLITADEWREKLARSMID